MVARARVDAHTPEEGGTHFSNRSVYIDRFTRAHATIILLVLRKRMDYNMVMSGKCRDILDRFWNKVQITNGCWIWIGCRDGKGYGLFSSGESGLRAHRFSWEIHNRLPLPAGHEMDHLCKNRSCVNPAHLEAVTQYVNNMRSDSFTAINRRKTHCKRGHTLEGPTVELRHRVGQNWVERNCMICRRMRYVQSYRPKLHRQDRFLEFMTEHGIKES